ncbi:alpha/beta hydrolase [Pseudomonas lundensis]|uniref:alpha/beta fold hydrolase n=1 Tax=Serratia proteamaculans TaxID=28151 RepID=UPI0029825C7B|nr:alpha/beta hydrolase [Serratia proteamaculans]MDW5498190.1 alpha/beta hydrolase [Serratia proteamaculans]MDW5503248.1 alpha/beta hydrolase [Pseudomonas lundensis]
MYQLTPWPTLPVPLPVVTPGNSAYARVNDIQLYFSIFGEGEPVILLHGGIASGDWWGSQIDFLVDHGYQVIAVDSRGNGRSTRSAQPYSYHLMAADVLALMDTLSLKRAHIVGWSDGAVIGLDIAIHHPKRLNTLFAFGLNVSPAGVKPGFDQTDTFLAAAERAQQEYLALSPTPDEFEAFVAQISHMWRREPNYSDAQLRSITRPVAIVAAEYDEAIELDHAAYISATIPTSTWILLRDVSHFAPLQDPHAFNQAMLSYLEDSL